MNVEKIKPIVFKKGAWSKHVPFAYELVRDLNPRIIVELGAHRGESYFSMCQSVKDHVLSTVCYAVDTWKGDEHAGIYGDEVFVEVNRINEENFANFSYLIRSTFEDAAKNFSDESIDLLHIDGFHTYDAVKADFEGWIDKVASGGIILFHDIMVRHGDFGVWKFWEELKEDYETFEFKHGYGLGVLFKEPGQVKNKTSLIESMLKRDSNISRNLHDYYQNYYEGLELSYKLKTLESENKSLIEKCENLDKQVLSLTQLYQDQSQEVDKLKGNFFYPFLRIFSKNF